MSASLPQNVTIRLSDAEGNPGPPVSSPFVVKSEDEWRAQLGEESFRVLRSQATERPFCGMLLDNKKPGIYVCAGCDLPLFRSKDKFDSGTGWPSFFRSFAPENVREEKDRSHGMIRTEILCARCHGHLGHVFEDGPRPTGLRYCLNSVSMNFRSIEELPEQG